MQLQRTSTAKQFTQQVIIVKSGFYLLIIAYLSIFIKFDLTARIKQLEIMNNLSWWNLALYLLIFILPLIPIKLIFDWSLTYHIPKKFALIKYRFLHSLKKSITSILVIYLSIAMVSYIYFYTINLKLPLVFPNVLNGFITPLIITLIFFLGLLLFSPFIPLVMKLKPVDESIVKRLSKYISKYNFKPSQIKILKDSDKTNIMNVFFMGYGPFKNITFSENFLKKATNDEIEVVALHEFGHYRQGHFLKGLSLFSMLIFLYSYLGIILLKRFAPTLNSAPIPDLSNLPLLFFIILLLNLVVFPLYLSVKREWEYNVDKFAIKQKNLSRAFISIMEKFIETNLKDPSPHYLIRLLFYTHPPTNDRINLAKRIKK